MKIIFRETCVLMGSFGKYMVFKAQLYEIWEPDFNMQSNIDFMHLSRLHFLCQDCPFGSILSIKKIGRNAL